VIILTALSLIGILGVTAIATDGGLLMRDQRTAQAVADAAALAAAIDLYQNYGTNQGKDPSGTASASALTTAGNNGYANDGTTSTVTVHIPPKTGTFAGQDGYAEVIVQFNRERNFSRIFGSGSIAVKARAVARGMEAPYSGAGILLLDPTGKAAFDNSGGGALAVGGNASVIIDSNNSEGASLSGSAVLKAANIYITGGSNLTGGAEIKGAVSYGVPPTPDPLASLPVPDPSTMPVISSSTLTYSSGTHTLSPGVYNGGIVLNSPAQAILTPGIYYLNGGGLTVTGGAGLTGNQVMIYNNSLDNGDKITISGSGTLKLTPPTSGVYAGLTLFQKRTSASPVVLSGGSNTNLTGTFYAASARVNVSGSSGITLGSQYISYDLTVSGGASFNVVWNPAHVARKRDIRLVE
jgi:hypothetical protein